MSVYISVCVSNVRVPVLATSVQEQLETGTESTDDVPDLAPQVSSLYCCVHHISLESAVLLYRQKF